MILLEEKAVRACEFTMVLRKIARASTSAERTFPALLQLLNSNSMSTFFHDVALVKILSRHVDIAANPIYAKMAAVMSDHGPGVRGPRQKVCSCI